MHLLSFQSSTARTSSAGRALMLLAFGAWFGCPIEANDSLPSALSFNRDIQPILSENCYACHGPDASARKGDLRLDRAEDAYAAREKSSPAIVPGKPEQSGLIRRIETRDEKEMMPPPEARKTLTEVEKALLRTWVLAGAEYEMHWAFIPPRRPAVPSVQNKNRTISRNAIDALVLERLQRAGLNLAPEADRAALLRRVTLDLTGLPPTLTEIEAFLAARSSGAYERVVDRLLASPRFGEHRARYWLDYVRYGDTHGINSDNHRAIWPYRDYLIRSFNANKPFDRFVREQLAGDLLPASTLDELIATGFIRSNLTTNEGGTVPEELLVNQVRDRVETFGATFLGLTTGCAACHDHKFDPLTQRDYYGLAAYLGNTSEDPWDYNRDAWGSVLRIPSERNRAAAEAVLARRAELERQLDGRRTRARELVATWIAAGNRPRSVSTDGLELRLPLNEGTGDTVHDRSPGAARSFQANTNPLIWGERSWLWPSMRMDILTRLPLGNVGDFEATDLFSAGGWLMLRLKPGGGRFADTGNGTLLSRMSNHEGTGGTGWELHHDQLRFRVRLMSGSTQNGLSVVTVGQFTRDEWLHVLFTYDGSRKATGIKLYVNGRLAATETKLDTLGENSIRTKATPHLGRRDDGEPMRETRFQDMRIYRRALSPAEVARLPFEDPAAEILARQPSPEKWTTDETFVVAQQFYLGEIDPETKSLVTAIESHRKAFDALIAGGTPTLVANEKSTPAYADILKRGDYFSRLERVEPATPHFLPSPPAKTRKDRRGLADWLLADDQPLLARVVVNRAWQELFGQGLVETTGDFGVMGARPTHPELLDWLAVEFRESGWDVKNLYRNLVMSATYRQSAAAKAEVLAKDRENRLLSRGPRFRMDAEMLRDAALAASGLLVEKVGGPPVKSYQPPGLWEEVAIPGSNTRQYQVGRGDDLYRRSVYSYWKRALPPPSMETFDAPTREVACVRRSRSNTPLQALVSMNDPQWVEAARKLAERAIKSAGDDEPRIDLIARLTLGRTLAAGEVAAVQRALAIQREHFATRPDDANALRAVGKSAADATLDSRELAAWSMVASAFLNLDEFLSK